ncbi:MAG: DUF4349 domain-containing protein [Planctomycetota bacterium]|jgi:hypothetical protein
MTMQAADPEDSRLSELLGRLKEPAPAEELAGAWRVIDSRLEWRKPMSPFASILSSRRPKLAAAMAAAAMLLLALVIGGKFAPIDRPDLGGIFSSTEKRSESAEYSKRRSRDAFVGAVLTDAAEASDHYETDNDMDTGSARGGEDAISDIPLGGRGVIGGGGYGRAREKAEGWAVPRAAPGRSRGATAGKSYQALAKKQADRGFLQAERQSRAAYEKAAEQLARNLKADKSGGYRSKGKRSGRYAPPAPAAKPGLPPVRSHGRRPREESRKAANRPGGRPGDPGKPAAKTAQKIIKTATLSLEVKKFADAGRKVDELVNRYSAFYADSKVTQNPDGTTGGYYVIRVPQQNFESLYAALKDLGRVKTENAKGVDVTAQFTDLAARIRNLKHMEQRLLALLAEKKKGNKMSEILEVERELGKRREEIEKLEGTMRVMVDKIDLGTIYLTIAEPSRVVPGASFTIEVKDASAADKSLDPMMASLGGQIVSRQSSKRHDGTLQVEVSLKVPMPRFGDLLNGIKALGRPDRESVQGFNPAAIAADPGAKDVLSTVRAVLFEPSSQKPGGVASIEVATLADAAKAIGALLTRLDGTLVSRNEQRRGQVATASYRVRVPRARFAELAASLVEIGRVDNKQLVGVDVVNVQGPAAKVPCELTMTVFERSRQQPSGMATLVVADLGGAASAIRNLLKTVEGQVVNHVENRNPGGTSSATYTLRCKRTRFQGLLTGLEPIGRLENKSVSGLDLEEVKGAAADALCTLTLTVQERVPGAALNVEVSDTAEAAKQLASMVAGVDGRTERVDKKKLKGGAAQETWMLRIPVKSFDGFVASVEDLGEIKSHEVQGLGESAKSLAAKDAYARVALTIYRPATITAHQKGTIKGTIAAAFKTLGWLLGIILFGLIVVVPAMVAIVLVIKLAAFMLRPRRAAAAAATAGTYESKQEDAPKSE